jgi:hypothetical protein
MIVLICKNFASTILGEEGEIFLSRDLRHALLQCVGAEIQRVRERIERQRRAERDIVLPLLAARRRRIAARGSFAVKTIAEASPNAPIYNNDLLSIRVDARDAKTIAIYGGASGGGRLGMRIRRPSDAIHNLLCRNILRKHIPRDDTNDFRPTAPRNHRREFTIAREHAPLCAARMPTCEDLSRDVLRRAARDRCCDAHGSDGASVEPVSMR